jgi:5-amino-6-(5-phosphoribosylamino)uracil reductase
VRDLDPIGAVEHAATLTRLAYAPSIEFRQLLPEPGSFPLAERLAALDLTERATDRPYTIANFVASADGRATFAGKSSALGDDGDHALFHGLREQVDAVLAGTRTLVTENYGRILGKAERRERRCERGLAPEPLACIVTRSGQVPLGIPLFAEPEARIVVFTAEERSIECAAQLEIVCLDPSELTLTTVMRRLRADYGVGSLLCEGGPTVFAALVRERLVDELFLTLSPKLTGGGEGPAVTSGPELPEPNELELVWALERAGSLFLRYALT